MGKACMRPGSSWPEGVEVSQDSGNGAQQVVHQQRQTDIYIQNSLSGLVWFVPFDMHSIRAPVGRDMKAVPS